MRLFLAINLPIDVRRDIVAATGPMRDCAPELGWVDETKLHLTLKFLDDQPPSKADVLRTAASRIAGRHRELNMRLGGIGAFPNFRRSRIVWMGVEQDPRLELLHNDIEVECESLGFDVDYKRLLREFQSRGNLLRAFYYTAVIEDQEYSSIRPLIDWLDYNGYSVVTKATKEFVDQTGRRKVKGNMDIELAVDAMELAPNIDHMVLFSGDGDFRSLVEAVQRRGVRVTVVSTVSTQPPMVADELRRQADVFLDIVELQTKIGRDPSERPPREARPPREDRAASHTPQFLQRAPSTPQRAGAHVGADDDEESFE